MSEIPQIIDIISIEGFNIICYFNNGEYRKINLKKISDKPQNNYDKKITEKEIFDSLFISDGNVAFKKLKFSFTLNNKRKYSYYSIGGDTIYNESEKIKIDLPIGTKIKHLRLKNNLTQEQLAQNINSSKSNLSVIEKNKHYPDIKTLEKIANYFGKKMIIDFVN